MRLELTTPAYLLHIRLSYKYRALTDCATRAWWTMWRSGSVPFSSEIVTISSGRERISIKDNWRCRGSNPGPHTCKACALPLSYIPWHLWWRNSACRSICSIYFIGQIMHACFKSKIMSFTRGETRTRNLRFRRPTPYPLGHAGFDNVLNLFKFLVINWECHPNEILHIRELQWEWAS